MPALCMSIFSSFLVLLHCIRLLRSGCRRSATMGKDKTAALERAKKAMGAAKGKKQNRGLSSCSALPPGWIQGDWIRSLLQQEDLDKLVESGLIAKGAARFPEGEAEPQQRPGECVLLATHVDRGF